MNSSYYEEDAWLMDRCFDSYLYTLHFNIPGYYEWMLTQDHTKAYQDFAVPIRLRIHARVPMLPMQPKPYCLKADRSLHPYC